MRQILVEQEFENLRLDKFLCKKFNLSFALAQKLIREKKVKVNQRKVDASYRVVPSDQIEIFSDLLVRNTPVRNVKKVSAEKIKKFHSWIIFEDDNLIIINKPSGLAVQGGSGIELSVDDLLAAIKNAEKNLFPSLVHRLDKDTSGILLIAKNKKAADFFTDLFRHKLIEKTYLALVFGPVNKSSGVISIPLTKRFLNDQEKVFPDFESGKEAITHYKKLKQREDYSLLELKPLTGRTHQLRVHCKEIGHPILNDVKYGGPKVIRKDLCSRLCLHAYQIKFQNLDGKVVEITTAMPEFLQK